MLKKKLTKKHLNYLLKDEKGASIEYEQLARGNPEFSKMFKEMSKDEHKHYKYLQK